MSRLVHDHTNLTPDHKYDGTPVEYEAVKLLPVSRASFHTLGRDLPEVHEITMDEFIAVRTAFANKGQVHG